MNTSNEVGEARHISSGALWSAADYWVQQISQLLTFIVVGNLLGPAITGIMSMALVAIMLLSNFLVSGFSDALVQRKELTSTHFNVTFWLLVGLGIGAGGFLWAVTPLIVGFFSEPELYRILPPLAATLPFIGVSACYQGMLQRQLRFRQLATRSIIAYGAGFVAALVLVLNGAGIFSLVGGFLVSRVLDAVLVVLVSGIRPSLTVSRQHFSDIFAYGRHRMLHQVLATMLLQVDRIVIGAILGPVALGLYAMAERLVAALMNGICGVVQRVSFPVLAQKQQDREAFDGALQAFFTSANTIAIPVFIGLAITSGEVVGVIFTDSWTGAIPIVAILCLSALNQPTNFVLTAATNALGRPQIVVQLTIALLVLRTIASIAAAQISVIAVAWAYVVVNVLSTPMFMAWTADLFRGRWRSLLGGSGAPILAVCVMAAVTLGTGILLTGQNELVVLVSKVFVGVISYGGTLYLLAPKLFRDAMAIATNRA